MTKIIDQFCLEESLGTNYYGFCTYRARHVETNQFFLVKSLSRVLYDSPGFLKEALDVEVKVIRRINHNNIIRFVKMLRTPNNTYIVYEWCNGGNLLDRISKGKLTEMEQTQYMRQLLLAVKELHAAGLVHMNLHPRTIYVGRDNNLKISNFAHCLDIKDTERLTYRTDKFRFQDYLAPEVLAQQPPNVTMDIYSLGLIFALIRYGKIDNLQTQLAQRIKSGQYLADMIQEMTSKQPSERGDLDTVKVRLGLGSSAQKQKSLLASSKSAAKLQKTDRKVSEDFTSPTNKLKPDLSAAMLPPSNEPSIDGSTGSKKLGSPNGTSNQLMPSRIMKSERQLSDAKSEVDYEYQENVVNKEIKRLTKQRNKFNYLLMIANDVMVQNLTATSTKLYYLISKKACLNAIALQKSLVGLERKRKGTAWEQVSLMTKIISRQIEDIKAFFGNLTKYIQATEKKILSIDSALELEVQSEDSLSEAFLRKLIKQYVTNVIGKVDLARREEQDTARKMLLHVNNVSDVQTLDKFFSSYINDSVMNLLDQVYFNELEKMEARELHRFVMEKCTAEKII